MSKKSIQTKMDKVMTSFEEIRKKLEGLINEFGIDGVKRALKEMEADKTAKEALQKLIDGLWKI
jgi:hypothetical protein